jgi:GNAT superfamily N-acetyltransferase
MDEYMKYAKPGIISKVPTHQEIQFLEDRVYEHNATETNRDDGKLFSKLICDGEDGIIAGITGWTWAAACEITLFWVNERYRKKGYGKMLLDEAEAEAIREKCKVILLRSYSFQAPRFYLKHGYKLEHETRDFPPGHNYFCLVKRLPE